MDAWMKINPGIIPETNPGELLEEVRKLKNQKNQLLDIIQEKNKEILCLKESLREQPTLANRAPDKILSDVAELMQRLRESRGAIPYKNATKKSHEYFKIRKKAFDQCWQGMSKDEFSDEKQEEKGKLIQFLISCGIVLSQENGKYFWSEVRDGKATSVVFIRRSAWDYFLQEGGAPC